MNEVRSQVREMSRYCSSSGSVGARVEMVVVWRASTVVEIAGE